MGTLELKNIISESLKTDDQGLLERIVEVIYNYKKNKTNSVLTDAQKAELDAIRARHISGESKSYSWTEIKQELTDKYGLQS